MLNPYGAALLGLLSIASPGLAAGDPAVHCCAGKLRATGMRERQLFRCHAKAAARGVAVDPACVAAVAEALGRAFARVESGGGCAGGDAGLVANDLDRVGATVATMVRPTPTASGCAARKLKAAGRLASSALRASARYAPRPTDHPEINPIVDELIQQLQGTFAGLEGNGGCPTTGDGAAVATAVLSGSTVPLPPDGVLLTALRVCPACGDDVRGGGEQCDGFDAATCPGACSATCACPTCGDGVVNQASEACDGADAASCQGLCQIDCTCPPPVCGNGVKESGEDCDGPAGACGSACQPDCTCAAVCGNGVVEPGEECEGTVCALDPFVIVGCSGSGAGGCRCCDGGLCGLLGCCHPGDTCVEAPMGYGTCLPPLFCEPGDPCLPGYTCTLLPGDTLGRSACLGSVGSPCAFPSPQYPTLLVLCLPPAVCSGSPFGLCVLP